MKKEYVLGFMFSKDKKDILLIEKQRPNYQKGRINGIGGKLESYTKLPNGTTIDVPEEPIDAMIREFKEECGVDYDNWSQFCKLTGKEWIIHIFRAFADELYDAETTTDELVNVHKLDSLPKNLMPNLLWLIPMSLENDKYVIEELYGI